MKRFVLTALSGAAVLAVAYLLPYGTWASFGGLPLHPLIVHGVVVLLPLVAIAILVLLFNRRWLGITHYVLLISIAFTTVGVLAAASSGNSLSAAVGLPQEHAERGNNLVPVALVLYALFAIYLFFTIYRPSRRISAALGFLVGTTSIATLALTFLVGHSGAESVWKSTYETSKVPIALSQDEIKQSEVANHATSDDCWTIVDGYVYDVTTFVNRHPAGAEAINEMCGSNASKDYLEEHSGQKEPGMWLETLKIGKLVP